MTFRDLTVLPAYITKEDEYNVHVTFLCGNVKFQIYYDKKFLKIVNVLATSHSPGSHCIPVTYEACYLLVMEGGLQV